MKQRSLRLFPENRVPQQTTDVRANRVATENGANHVRVREPGNLARERNRVRRPRLVADPAPDQARVRERWQRVLGEAKIPNQAVRGHSTRPSRRLAFALPRAAYEKRTVRLLLERQTAVGMEDDAFQERRHALGDAHDVRTNDDGKGDSQKRSSFFQPRAAGEDEPRAHGDFPTRANTKALCLAVDGAAARSGHARSR